MCVDGVLARGRCTSNGTLRLLSVSHDRVRIRRSLRLSIDVHSFHTRGIDVFIRRLLGLRGSRTTLALERLRGCPVILAESLSATGR